MNYKQLMIDMRVNKQLKGKKPAIVFINKNQGRIYRERKRRIFVMALNEEGLHFHALSRYFKVYKPEFDFGIRTKDIKKYYYQTKYGIIQTITFYTHKGFYLPFSFMSGTKASYETNINIDYILKYLEENGVVNTDVLDEDLQEEDHKDE